MSRSSSKSIGSTRSRSSADGCTVKAERSTTRIVLFYKMLVWPLASMMVVVMLALATETSRISWLGPWSFRYVVLGLMPAVFLAAVCLWIPFRLEMAEKLFRNHPFFSALAAVGLVAGWMYWTSRFPSGGRQLAAVALVIVFSLECASILLRKRALLLSAATLAVVVTLVGIFEAVDGSPRPVVWGHPSTMACPFPRDPPFIGAGGRLNPGLDAWLVRSVAEQNRRLRIHTNSVGFRNDLEFEIPLDRDVPSVLSLGDSFSNGFGISQAEFYGARLQFLLRESCGPGALVLNAEVSDPCYGLHYLETYGVAYRPKMVIYNLSANDSVQSLWGCGSSGVFRLDAEGHLQVREDRNRHRGHRYEDWGEFIYPVKGDPRVEASHGAGPQIPEVLEGFLRLRVIDRLRLALSRPPESGSDQEQRHGELTGSSAAKIEGDGHKRLFDGFPNLGMAYRKTLRPREESLEMLFALIEAMQKRASGVGAGFLVVYFPQRHQVQTQDWDVMCERWQLDPEDFDVDLEPRRIGQFCSLRGISFLDLTGAFRKAATDRNLYLPFDGHFNEEGHELAAQMVAPRVISYLAQAPLNG